MIDQEPQPHQCDTGCLVAALAQVAERLEPVGGNARTLARLADSAAVVAASLARSTSPRP